jgi:hypothetical protein
MQVCLPEQAHLCRGRLRWVQEGVQVRREIARAVGRQEVQQHAPRVAVDHHLVQVRLHHDNRSAG